ncbi:hypothetical protein D3C72_1840230 [compost metagenome]
MQHARDHGAVFGGNQLRTPIGVADGVGFFEHQVLPSLEARDRHGEGKAQQKRQEAEQGGLQRENVGLGGFVGRLAQPASQAVAQLDDGEEDDEHDEKQIDLVKFPEHAVSLD